MAEPAHAEGTAPSEARHRDLRRADEGHEHESRPDASRPDEAQAHQSQAATQTQTQTHEARDDGHQGGECSVPEGLRRLVQLLPQVTRGWRRRKVAPTRAANLGPRHGAALLLLDQREREPLTVGRLAADLGLTLATVSGVVADLERAGFVTRAVDPDDRRRTFVRLVEDRRPAAEAWLERTTAPLARVLDRLSPEERATFVKAMALLEAELNPGPCGRAAPPA